MSDEGECSEGGEGCCVGIGPPLVAVTGSQRPYVFDLPNLLSLPAGFEFRFRYRHRWVDPEVAQQPEKFTGRPLLILFHSQEGGRLLPIRRGVITSLETVGPMLLLRFRLGNFVDVNVDLREFCSASVEARAIEGARAHLATVGESILRQSVHCPAFDPKSTLPEHCFLRQCPKEPGDVTWESAKSRRNDRLDAWARIAALLHGEPSLAGIPMFFLAGFQDAGGKRVEATIIRNELSATKTAIRGFSLIEHERYTMQVLQWAEPPVGNAPAYARVNCECSSDYLALEGKSDLVLGRYDMLDFTFLAAKTGGGELALKVVFDSQEGGEPIRATPSRRFEVQDADRTPVAFAGIESGTSTTPRVVHEGVQPGEREGDLRQSWRSWPSIFVARVPVRVRINFSELGARAAISVLGFGGFFYAGTFAPAGFEKIVQAASLYVAFAAFGGESFGKLAPTVLKFIKGGG